LHLGMCDAECKCDNEFFETNNTASAH